MMEGSAGLAARHTSPGQPAKCRYTAQTVLLKDFVA